MSIKAIVVLSSLIAASAASADIGFAAAVDASRAATPGNAMFSIQQRVRNGVMIYEGEHYNAGLTSRFQPRIGRNGRGDPPSTAAFSPGCSHPSPHGR